MIERKTWKEFRKTGLLWFVNTILQAFGWSIVLIRSDDGEITGAYPARVNFRGFPEESNTKGYNAVAKYLKENIDNIIIENEENEDA